MPLHWRRRLRRGFDQSEAIARFALRELARRGAATPELVASFDQLVALGLTLALDDFGTGYSSLSYLKRLPLRRLKIDRSFVDGLPDNPEDVAITSATLSLARDLGMEVVAEGVETEEQRAYLRSRGCGAMQGYLFSRPLGVKAFEEWAWERATALA